MKYLSNQVFHVTSIKAYENILKDNKIFHNKDEKFPINTSSKGSYGRLKGFVCLFDLRGKDESVIENTLNCYNFLVPDCSEERCSDYIENNSAYFILKPESYKKLIPNSTGWQEDQCKLFVPKTECWFPGDMPLEHVSKILLVRIHRDVPVQDSLGYEIYQIHRSLEKGDLSSEDMKIKSPFDD